MAFNNHFAEQQFLRLHVRNGSEADVTLSNFDVRFTPESGHSPRRSGCLLWANSGHELRFATRTISFAVVFRDPMRESAQLLDTRTREEPNE